jgi:hypothetical protein
MGPIWGTPAGASLQNYTGVSGGPGALYLRLVMNYTLGILFGTVFALGNALCQGGTYNFFYTIFAK